MQRFLNVDSDGAILQLLASSKESTWDTELLILDNVVAGLNFWKYDL